MNQEQKALLDQIMEKTSCLVDDLHGPARPGKQEQMRQTSRELYMAVSELLSLWLADEVRRVGARLLT